MTEPEARYYESSRLRLHYAVWGDDSKPPLLLVHGSRDHARSWDFVAQRLTDRFCVYAPDLRGHGDSDWAIGGPYSVASYVADLAKLVEVIDAGPVYLVAHSLGGRIALDYASAFPDRVTKLVAIEGFGRVGSADPPADRLRRFVASVRELEQREPHHYPTLAAAEERMQEANKRLTPEMVEHLTKHAVRRLEDGSYVWKFDNYMRLTPAPEWTPDDTMSLWKQITAPTLHIGGSDSWGKRFPDGRETMTRAVPNERTVLVQGAGHWVHHDQLDEFVKLVRDFFEP
jgi:pimeloyl-ACP methyl ester carboxylesterase